MDIDLPSRLVAQALRKESSLLEKVADHRIHLHRRSLWVVHQIPYIDPLLPDYSLLPLSVNPGSIIHIDLTPQSCRRSIWRRSRL
jgi:hypothetical protein